MSEDPPEKDSTENRPANTRALHFTSRREVESRPGFDSTILVTLQNYAGLVGDYNWPEVDWVTCQLRRKTGPCNHLHGVGWVARTKHQREGYIGGDCADKYFEDTSQFVRDRSIARRQIDMDQLLARVAAAKADSTIPPRLRAASEQLRQLCSDTQAVVGQLPQELVRKLRDMAISGRGDVQIDIGYEEPPDPERPDSKPTIRWQRTSVATVRAPKAADLEFLRSLVARLHVVRVAWKDLQTTTHTAMRKLRDLCKALESLPYVETEVQNAGERWAEFRIRENLMSLVILVDHESGRRAVVRLAMGDVGKPALRTAWRAAQDQIAAVTDGRPFRIP
jgi:hypothetical protein